MSPLSLKQLIEELDRLKRPDGTEGPDSAAPILALLGQIAKQRFTDAADFAIYHEALLFIRAHPANRAMLSAAEKALRKVASILQLMHEAGIDLSPLAEADMSGIAGTSVSGVFSYPVAAWLARNHSGEVEIDWDGYVDEARLAETLPRFLPLLEDETLVEAHFPYLEWLRSAAGAPTQALPWLIARFAELNVAYARQAELYNSLRLYPIWTPRRFAASRTGMRFPQRGTFFHTGPMIARREVSIAAELDGPPLPVERLSSNDGAAILELIRQTSTQRYRELHGFSYGDPSAFIRVDAGRGIDIYVNETTPERRLPWRAYHSGFLVKNGVPIGYVEGLSLFDRMEIGFNIYYTFRDGESAYLYARVMKTFHQLLGINCFSVDPYQIGHENEEGLASGAFWFYRKLGFQPARPELLTLVRAEEKKIAAKTNYRTPVTTLAKLAAGHVFYDSGGSDRDWSSFQVRNIGLAVQRRMRKFNGGRADEFRAATEAEVARWLGVKPNRWPSLDQKAFANWAAVLFLIDELGDWSSAEKKLTARMIRAKGSGTEAQYLELMQKHARLRNSLLALGSMSK
ncbi:MAG: hypothetical protein ABIP75_09530 [Pyrinomonadaceae bacterium]